MIHPTCSVSDCERIAWARGLCGGHYQRWRKHGNPEFGGRLHPPHGGFWPRVEKTATCWLWTGATGANGYGLFRGQLVHRTAYQELVGPIPAGLQLDHLCRVRRCVNPAHLEPVTRKVNILRGMGASALNARKTHCKWGHEFTPDNIYWVRNGTTRACRTCAIRHAANGKRRARARRNAA